MSLHLLILQFCEDATGFVLKKIVLSAFILDNLQIIVLAGFNSRKKAMWRFSTLKLFFFPIHLQSAVM